MHGLTDEGDDEHDARAHTTTTATTVHSGRPGDDLDDDEVLFSSDDDEEISSRHVTGAATTTISEAAGKDNHKDAHDSNENERQLGGPDFMVHQAPPTSTETPASNDFDDLASAIHDLGISSSAFFPFLSTSPLSRSHTIHRERSRVGVLSSDSPYW